MKTYETLEQTVSLDIALVGMAGRFPGAKNLDKFWDNLQNGVESISFFSHLELMSSSINCALLNDPNYVKAASVLEDIERFDASFFGFSPREAEVIDPQHRFFLECAWEALESAGYDPETYDGLIGVYAGTSMNTYLLHNLYPNRDAINQAGGLLATYGIKQDFLTTSVSYKLNLKGPSITVQTFCSTSLVAVHLACQSLLNEECDMALAGGVSIKVPQKAGYFYQKGGILSPDGHCRAFDAKAQGTIFGNGVGIVVLKRLENALADGDYIHAVIKGSAINNDGSLKVSFTAPSVNAQAELIVETMENAGVDAEDITYIETHGTGTAMGDPIEIAALTKAFRTSTQKKGFCAIGSVKTNIGHLDAASGIANLIKTTLALKHKLIPPSLHFEQANPQIDFAKSPFYVNTKLSEWKTERTPRRAGVSSLGFGGTNAHVILEEAPASKHSSESRSWQLLMLSAKTRSALEVATANLVAYLKQHSNINFANVAYTLQVGRRAFNHRQVVLCQDIDDAVTALETHAPERVFTVYQDRIERPVVFMFSGQGAQYVNMALELYQVEPTFREQVDICSDILKPHLGFDLPQVLYPSEERVSEAELQLKQTAITQPALFVIEYALAKLWMEWGISPVAMIGHSIGEYVAACLAGVFSLEDALSLVVARSQLMQQLPSGTMLAVPLPEKEVEPLLSRKLSLATINGPSLCVVSGSADAVEELQNQLASQSVDCRRLHTTQAFHSEMMEPILATFTEQVKKVSLKAPQIPYLSNVTGTWITAAQATSPSYWAKHLRQTVRFAEGLQQLLKEPTQILLEVGPGRTLSTLARSHPDKATEQLVLTSLRHPQENQSDLAFLLNTLGRLWGGGVKVDWSGFYAGEQRHRLPLPTYPFERQRYWIEQQGQAGDVPATQASLGKKPDIADWFYLPLWKQSVPPALLVHEDLAHQNSCTLVFIDECGLGSQLVKQLKQQGQDAIAVRVGSEFAQQSDRLFTLNPQKSSDYDALLDELLAQNKIPKTIVHLWSVTPHTKAESGLEWFDKAQEKGFYSLLFLTQALGKQDWTDEFQIAVVSNNMQSVTGVEMLCPEKATVLGPVRVIPQEYPNISCRSIDVALPSSGSWQEKKLVDQLLSELHAHTSELVVAYRGLNRWVQTFEPVRLDEAKVGTPRLREGGVYLITGGLGSIGLTLAEYLAQTVHAKLVLLGHSDLPERDEWSGWLTTHDNRDDVSRRIRKVQALEESGAEVLVKSADVSNLKQMQTAIASAEERFGEIHGVIHAAEIVGGNSHRAIQETSQTDCQVQFQPKVYGLFVLEKVLHRRGLDFYLLISSLASVLGGLGYAAYSAANIFMDAFAHRQNQTSPIPWFSVNWDRWQLEEKEEQNTERRTTLTELFITPNEGMEVFQSVLTRGKVTQVVVSIGDLQARIDQWLKLGSLQDIKHNSEELVPASLSKTLHPRPKLWNDYVAPRTPVERTLAHIWQQVLSIDRVGIHDDFFELGGHSLLAVHLMAKIKKQLGQTIQLSTLFQRATIEHQANILRQQANDQPSSPLVAIQPHGSKPPLFFVHPIGGNVLCYYELSLQLGSEQPFYGLQALGLDGECEPYTRIEDMANRYIEALRVIQPESPYLLGGWSMGGVVAFEMATQLQRQGHKVTLLAMLDSPAPVASGLHTDIDDYDDVRILVDFAIDMARFAGKNLSGSVDELQKLGLDEQLDYFLKQAKMVDLLPPDFDLQQLRCLIKLFKSNLRALRSYIPQVYPNRIIYFQASDKASDDFHNPHLRWNELSIEPIETIAVPGDHYTIVTQPHIQILAKWLNIYLNEV